MRRWIPLAISPWLVTCTQSKGLKDDFLSGARKAGALLQAEICADATKLPTVKKRDPATFRLKAFKINSHEVAGVTAPRFLFETEPSDAIVYYKACPKGGKPADCVHQLVSTGKVIEPRLTAGPHSIAASVCLWPPQVIKGKGRAVTVPGGIKLRCNAKPRVQAHNQLTAVPGSARTLLMAEAELQAKMVAALDRFHTSAAALKVHELDEKVQAQLHNLRQLRQRYDEFAMSPAWDAVFEQVAAHGGKTPEGFRKLLTKPSCAMTPETPPEPQLNLTQEIPFWGGLTVAAVSAAYLTNASEKASYAHHLLFHERVADGARNRWAHAMDSLWAMNQPHVMYNARAVPLKLDVAADVPIYYRNDELEVFKWNADQENWTKAGDLSNLEGKRVVYRQSEGLLEIIGDDASVQTIRKPSIPTYVRSDRQVLNLETGVNAPYREAAKTRQLHHLKPFLAIAVPLVLIVGGAITAALNHGAVGLTGTTSVNDQHLAAMNQHVKEFAALKQRWNAIQERLANPSS